MAHIDDGFIEEFGAAYANAERRMVRCEQTVFDRAYRFADRLKSGKGITVEYAGQFAESLTESYKRYRSACDEYIVLDRLAVKMGYSVIESKDDCDLVVE